MKIQRIVMGYVETNSYIFLKDDTTVIIDPCMDPHLDASRLLDALGTRNVDAILLTHGHFDHISAVDILVEQFRCPVYMYHTEVDYLKKPNLNLSATMPEVTVIHAEPIAIKEGTLSVGSLDFEVMLTPGHTSGSISYIHENLCFDGDFIFKGTVGRTDLPTGSQRQMLASIRSFAKKYKKLRLALYPGHGETTTLQEEMRSNPYFKS